jgi:hypothetical protein
MTKRIRAATDSTGAIIGAPALFETKFEGWRP